MHLKATSRRLVSLRSPGVGWRVEDGCLDVFFMRADGQGPRHHVMRLTAGCSALPVAPFEGYALFAVPTAGSIVCEASAVDTVARDGWCRALAAALDLPSSPGELEQFHQAAMARILTMVDASLYLARARADALVERDTRLLDRSLGTLAGRPRRPREPSSADVPPMVLACEALSLGLGVEIRVPEHATGADAVPAIAQHSGLRARRVRFEGEWWRRDCGPLLAFTAVGHRPLVLGHRHDRYYLFDPIDGSERRVDAAVAASLDGVAWSFCRPLPDGPQSLRTILRFAIRGCRGDVIAIVGWSCLGGLLGLLPPLATRAIFATVIPSADRVGLRQIAAILIGAAAGGCCFAMAREHARHRLEGRIERAIEPASWNRLLNLPATFFRSFTAGDLADRFMGLTQARRLLVGSTLSTAMTSAFSLFSAALLFYLSVSMALVASGLVALAVIVLAVCTYQSAEARRESMRLQGQISGMTHEILAGIAKIRAAGLEQRMLARWAALFARQKQGDAIVRRWATHLATFHAAFPVVSQAVMFAAFLRLTAADSALGTGEFIAFNTAFLQVMAGTQGLATTVSTLLEVWSLRERFAPLLQTPSETQGQRRAPGHLGGTIEVSHVTYRYAPDLPPALVDVSFRVAPGEFVAIVGASGSGKSTLVRLLMAFDRPERGAVYYDGDDLASLDPQSVRRQIGTVLQHSSLMPGTIFENIVGAASLTVDHAWTAARLAGIEPDLRRLPMGLHTLLAEGGGGLSGGQRQRLLVARALAARPRILIFDEATSALDNEVQATLVASLDSLRATRIVIAHRLSTIVNADRVLVMDGGRIVDEGRYQELLARGGPFAELVRRQLP